VDNGVARRRVVAGAAAALWLAALAFAALAGAGLKQQKVYDVGSETLETEFVKLPGDSRTDLVVTNRGDGDLSIFEGRRNGRLKSPVDVPAGPEPLGITSGDFNRDGLRDLAVANQTPLTGGVTVLLSAPGGGFVLPAQTFPATEEATYVVAAHFTSDRRLDLAVSGFVDGEISVLEGDGTGDFDPLPTITGKPGAFPIGTGDFDRDGETDLVVGGEDNEIDFYAGIGNGEFEAPVATPAGEYPNGLAVGRINSDRKLDVAVANYGGIGSVSVLLGKGNGKFKRRQINYKNENSPTEIEILRFDRDRHADLAFVDGSKDRLVILRGKGRGRFRAPRRMPTGADPYGMGGGRLHGDRLTDLAVTNYEDQSVSVYLGK
jgi:FG-GAP-like repeat